MSSQRVESPYDNKTITEIIHDYVVVRGDLSEQYAQDQLVRIIEDRIAGTNATPEPWAHPNTMIGRT